MSRAFDYQINEPNKRMRKQTLNKCVKLVQVTFYFWAIQKVCHRPRGPRGRGVKQNSDSVTRGKGIKGKSDVTLSNFFSMDITKILKVSIREIIPMSTKANFAIKCTSVSMALQ